MKRPPRSQGRWLFATRFLKDPVMLGSVIPSSRYLVERMLEPVDWEKTRYIVEYGPGVGTVTHKILDRMRPDAKLLALELNADLAEYLKREIDDPRLTVIQGSAEDVERLTSELDWERVDYAISGIPFSTMPEAVCNRILEVTRDVLRPGGEFIVFQFSNKVFPALRKTFDSVEKGFVFRNFLPAHCYRCCAGADEEAAVESERKVAQA